MIKVNSIYYIDNKELGLDDKVPGHNVLVVKRSKNNKRVKVKTITSLESPSKIGEKRKFKSTKLDLVKMIHDGDIIVVPKKHLNTPRLSGVYKKGIWVNKKSLKKSKYKTYISSKYRSIIGK